MAAVCTTTVGNTGVKCDKGDVRGVPEGFFLTQKSFKFDSYVDFADESVWLTKTKSKEIFPIGGFLEFDDNTEESVYYTSGLGIDVFLRDGKYKFVFRANYGIEQNKEIQKFSGIKGRLFFRDSNGYIWGKSDDGTTVQGFAVSTFKAENKKVPTADAPEWSSINITLSNPREMNDDFILLNPSFDPADISGLANVDLTVAGTPTATEIVISVGNPTGVINEDGSIQFVPMAGIPITDFKFLKDSDGLAQTPDSMTETSDGVYNFVFTALETGTGDLISAATQTNDYLIESTGAISYTI